MGCGESGIRKGFVKVMTAKMEVDAAEKLFKAQVSAMKRKLAFVRSSTSIQILEGPRTQKSFLTVVLWLPARCCQSQSSRLPLPSRALSCPHLPSKSLRSIRRIQRS